MPNYSRILGSGFLGSAYKKRRTSLQSSPPAQAQEAVAADEAPSPVEARKKVLSPEKRAELRALLVGADLNSFTVGEVRTQLEERLGLEPGALLLRRKELGRTLQHEVFRRLHADATVEKISKVLMSIEDYPRASALMLIEALPSALAKSEGSRHKHQLELLGMVGGALEDARAAALAAIAGADARFKAADREVRVAGLNLERSWLASLIDGPLRTLIDGTWADEGAMNNAISAVQQRLVVLKVEEALVLASKKALSTKPEDRGMFARSAIAQIEELVAERVASIDRTIMASGAGDTEIDVHPAFTQASSSSASSPAKRRASAAEGVAKSRQQVEDLDDALSSLKSLMAEPSPESFDVPVEVPADVSETQEAKETSTEVPCEQQPPASSPAKNVEGVEIELKGSPSLRAVVVEDSRGTPRLIATPRRNSRG